MVNQIGDVNYKKYDAQKTEIREITEKSINSLFERNVIDKTQRDDLLQMYLSGDVTFGDDGLTEQEALQFTQDDYSQIKNSIDSNINERLNTTMYIVQAGDKPKVIAEKLGLTGQEAEDFAKTLKENAQKDGVYYKYGFRVGDIIRLPGNYRQKLKELKEQGQYNDSTGDINNNYHEVRRQKAQERRRAAEGSTPTTQQKEDAPGVGARPTKPTRPSQPSQPTQPSRPSAPKVPTGPTKSERNQANAQKIYKQAIEIVKALEGKVSPKNEALNRINSENVVFVLKMYQDKTGRSLIRDLWNNGDKTGISAHNKICWHLCKRAKELGIDGVWFREAKNTINHKNDMLSWIDKIYPKMLDAEKKNNPAFGDNNLYNSALQGKSKTRAPRRMNTIQTRKDGQKLATEIHEALTDKFSGDWKTKATKIKNNLGNEITKSLLKKINTSNVAFVVQAYKQIFEQSLAERICDNERNLGINDVKNEICGKLVNQAKALGLQGIYHSQYQKINDIKQLSKWIDQVSEKIIKAMDDVAIKPQKEESTTETRQGGGVKKTITSAPMFKEAGITKCIEEYDQTGKKIRSHYFYRDGKEVIEEEVVEEYGKNKKGQTIVIKETPLYDRNGNKTFNDKNYDENKFGIVKKRRLIKSGKPIAENWNTGIYEPVNIDIKMPNNASENAKKFAQALQKNKAHLMQVLKIDNDTYNRLVKLALAIAEQETNFGNNEGVYRRGKYALGDTIPGKVVDSTVYSLSYGMTQIKYSDHIKDADVKKLFETLGITKATDLYDADKSAIATVALLSVINRRIQGSEKYQNGRQAAEGAVCKNDGWEMVNGKLTKTYNTRAYVNHITNEDMICYNWNGRGKTMIDGTADPQALEYTRNVRQYMKKYTIKEDPADRQAALEKSKGKQAVRNFKPIDNLGAIGSIIFMPKMYTNKPVNKAEEIKVLENTLAKNNKVNKESKDLLIKAVKNGEIAFEFGLTEKEIMTLTQKDVDKLLANLDKLKTTIESQSNVKFSDGIDSSEAQILGSRFKEKIRRTELRFRREYLNSHSPVTSIDNVPAENVLNTPMSNNMTLSTFASRRGFAGSANDRRIVDKGVNRTNTTAASAKLAEAAQSVANRRNSSGWCMTAVREAMRKAGIDDSDLVESKPRATISFFQRHPDMFEEVKFINVGGNKARQINSTDIPNLPAGYFVIFVPDQSNKNFKDLEGHISITNGNGQAYADETDNTDWGAYSGSSGSGKGEHGYFRVFRLTNKWEVGADGKLHFKG